MLLRRIVDRRRLQPGQRRHDGPGRPAKGIDIRRVAGQQVAPLAATRTYNNRYFFSSRINPKSLVYQGIYQDFSIGAMALK